MIYKLSDRVWWSDIYGAKDSGAEVILCVGSNVEPPETRNGELVIKHAAADEEDVSGKYSWTLWRLLRFLRDVGRFPILIHCLSGQHRSANVAVYAEWILNDRPLQDCWEKARALRHDIGNGTFAKTLAIGMNPSNAPL